MQIKKKWSTIIDNYQQFAKEEKEVNNYQQLPTIILGSTIIDNYQQFANEDKVVNNYRQLPTIFFAPLVAIAAVVNANIVNNLIEDN